MTPDDFVAEGRANHWRHKNNGNIYVTRANQTLAELLDELAQPEATPAPRRVVDGVSFLARVTDQEMAAVLAAAAQNIQIARWVEQLRMLGEIDLDGATAQAAKAGLVAAGLLTAERADIVFA